MARSRAAARVAALGLPFDLRLRLDPARASRPGSPAGGSTSPGRRWPRPSTTRSDRPLLVDLRADEREALIAIDTGLGVLETEVPRSRLSVSNPHQLLVLMILAAVLLTAVAIVFLRNQVRPIGALAEAAEAFGKGRSLPFRPAGAEEVRRAGAVFLSMRSRLERQIEQRTQMLSGVSHDLRTPLTRMKLTLELMEPGEEVRDLRQDVDQMERMLAEFLAFARGDGLEETVPTDPFALAEGIVDDARRAGTEIRLACLDETRRGGPVALRPERSRRAVQNLVGNAAEHGRQVALTVRLRRARSPMSSRTTGPGIPEADRARVLQPFARLDAARTQNAVAASASASPSPSTSPAATAARSSSARAPSSAASRRRSGSRVERTLPSHCARAGHVIDITS